MNAGQLVNNDLNNFSSQQGNNAPTRFGECLSDSNSNS